MLDVHIGPVQGTVDFRLTEDGDGTVLSFREKPTGSSAALTPALRPLLYARNRLSLRRLQNLLAR